MTRRTLLPAVALVAIAAMLATACSGGRGKASPTSVATTTTTVVTPTRRITIAPLFVAKNAAGHSIGGTEAVAVDIRPSIDRKLRVAFSETAVAGTGAQWQAAGWDAVTAATLLTGAPLSNREIDFDVTGRIDGPSAGALMTVAVIALIRGDTIRNDITMTGTINPDGTIGPVDGIPYKVDAAAAAHKTRMLIPKGQRNSADDTGKIVDVVQEAQREGIQASEVADIYDAYRQFTGVPLPQLPASTDTKLSESAYERIKAKVGPWLAKYDAAASNYLALDGQVRQDLAPYATAAAKDSAQAKKLE